ncbi:MAG: GNAT family N-acetyltransferase [Gemmatimonadales bacterium]|nr:GNAT family N-acetyltransferase [Gemmatimonadales bacterium]
MFRRAEVPDAAALAAFAARVFVETYGPDNRPEDLAEHLATSYGVPQQTRELADPDYVTLLMEDAGNVIAYAQIRRHAPPPCVEEPGPVELYRFYVDRPHQGRGVAQRLMTAACEVAREMGGRAVWLSVWERNPRAIAFYLKCGFRDVGATHFYVGTDRQNDRVLMVSLEAAI